MINMQLNLILIDESVENMKKLKTYIYFLFLQIILFGITISPNTLAGELENKAQEHVTSYYVNDIFADLELQIKQKIISDVKMANIAMEPKDLDIIADAIAVSASSAFEDFVPDIATKLMMKYYSMKEIEALNEIYGKTSSDGISFARKNYYFNRELNTIIMSYFYNNIDQIIEEELNQVLSGK